MLRRLGECCCESSGSNLREQGQRSKRTGSGVQLPKPESYVAVEITKERMLHICEECSTLLYHDARHQIWIRGIQEEQLVLDELGMLYVYPDDFLFRETLDASGWIEAKHESMADRDYVKVFFDAQADEQEKQLLLALGMIRWEG